MMKNRIVRLTTVVFSLFVLSVSYGVGQEVVDTSSTVAPQVKVAKPSKAKKLHSKKLHSKKARSKKARSKKSANIVSQLGKVDKSGDIKSFKGAAENIKNYMQATLTPKSPKKLKSSTYTAIRVIARNAGRENFDTDAHYNVAKDLVAVALKNKSMTGVPAISKGLVKLQKELDKVMADPQLRERRKLGWMGRLGLKKSKTAKKTEKSKAPAKHAVAPQT